MSKNFELLQHISNEKGLFQTLEGWEDAAAASEPAQEVEAEGQRKTSDETSLPDVFEAVNEPVHRSGDFTSHPSCKAAPVEESGRSETAEIRLEERFPISRNPITPLNSAPPAADWLERELGSERSREFFSKVEARFKPGAFERIPIHEAWSNAERGADSGDARVFTPAPTEEARSGQGRPVSHTGSEPELPARAQAEKSKATGNRRGGRLRARNIYKDAKRELITREEEFKLAQRIFLGPEKGAARIALFSGLEHDGGCASICVRVAEVLAAQTKEQVCLVEASFRQPSLHEYLGMQDEKGLAEAIHEPGPIQEFAQQISPANLWLISGGHGASLNVTMAADQLRRRMEELRDAYRYVVVHSGPLWLNAEAMMLSKWTDGVVLILEANSTRRDAARRIKDTLAAANTKVLGAVLNNRSYPIPESLYCRL